MPRLQRSDLSAPGIRRRRCGHGFHYRWSDGSPVADDGTLARIKQLAVPPAWKDVWICPRPNGHIQAVGVDAAGRRQYRYHDTWRAHRDREKYDRALRFAASLPELRGSVSQDYRRDGLDRERIVAAVLRLLDLGAFRVGGLEYAETNETYGLVSLLRRHVRVKGDVLFFDYPTKGSLERAFETTDGDVASVVATLKRRRGSDQQLFTFKEQGRWHGLRTEDVNIRIKQTRGDECSAKDFRNWHATVLATALPATSDEARSTRARRRDVKQAIDAVAEQLGNTPAVCKSSYIDPRVIDLYSAGEVISSTLARRMLGQPSNVLARQAVEAAVTELLGGTGTQALAA